MLKNKLYPNINYPNEEIQVSDYWKKEILDVVTFFQHYESWNKIKVKVLWQSQDFSSKILE